MLRRPIVNPSQLSASWLQVKTTSQLLLSRENSLPDISLCDHTKQCSGGQAENRQKTWGNTEQELDALRQALRPRRKRGLFRSQSVAPVVPSPTPEVSPPQPDLTMASFPVPLRIKKPLFKLFANLPKLPFGQHRSYNDVPDRRLLFVPIPPTRRVRKVIGRPFKQA